MSQSQTPIATVFDLQRTALTQSQEAFRRNLEAGQRAADVYLDSLETALEASQRGTTVSKAAVDAYFDAVEANVPGDAEGVAQLRETVLEQLDAGAHVQAETWANVQEVVEENVAAYDQFAEDYAALVEDSFDAALQAHEQVEEQTLTAAERVEAQFDAAAEGVDVPVDE